MIPEYQYINEHAFIVTDFLTPEECDAGIQLAESLGFQDAPINTLAGPAIRSDVRNNARVMHDDPPRAEELWSRMVDYVPLHIGQWSACGLNERFRFYRYDVGQQFDWHRDGYYQRDDCERSHLTVLLYLNEGFRGGETTLEDALVVPTTGMALCFVHQFLHKGEPVVEGRKYVLRSDVMYRRNL